MDTENRVTPSLESAVTEEATQRFSQSLGSDAKYGLHLRTERFFSRGIFTVSQLTEYMVSECLHLLSRDSSQPACELIDWIMFFILRKIQLGHVRNESIGRLNREDRHKKMLFCVVRSVLEVVLPGVFGGGLYRWLIAPRLPEIVKSYVNSQEAMPLTTHCIDHYHFDSFQQFSTLRTTEESQATVEWMDDYVQDNWGKSREIFNVLTENVCSIGHFQVEKYSPTIQDAFFLKCLFEQLEERPCVLLSVLDLQRFIGLVAAQIQVEQDALCQEEEKTQEASALTQGSQKKKKKKKKKKRKNKNKQGGTRDTHSGQGAEAEEKPEEKPAPAVNPAETIEKKPAPAVESLMHTQDDCVVRTERSSDHQADRNQSLGTKSLDSTDREQKSVTIDDDVQKDSESVAVSPSQSVQQKREAGGLVAEASSQAEPSLVTCSLSALNGSFFADQSSAFMSEQHAGEQSAETQRPNDIDFAICVNSREMALLSQGSLCEWGGGVTYRAAIDGAYAQYRFSGGEETLPIDVTISDIYHETYRWGVWSLDALRVPLMFQQDQPILYRVELDPLFFPGTVHRAQWQSRLDSLGPELLAAVRDELAPLCQNTLFLRLYRHLEQALFGMRGGAFGPFLRLQGSVIHRLFVLHSGGVLGADALLINPQSRDDEVRYRAQKLSRFVPGLTNPMTFFQLSVSKRCRG